MRSIPSTVAKHTANRRLFFEVQNSALPVSSFEQKRWVMKAMNSSENSRIQHLGNLKWMNFLKRSLFCRGPIYLKG